MSKLTATTPTVDVFHPCRPADAVARMWPMWPSERLPFRWGADRIANCCDADRAVLFPGLNRSLGLRYLLEYAPALSEGRAL